MLEPSAIAEAAVKAERAFVNEFSIVTSGTGVVDDAEIEILSGALREMKKHTSLETCASLGIMTEERLKALKEAGLESFHHNLETARSFFPSICTTHDYDDDVSTVRLAKKLGFHVCSGGVFGLGESFEQRVELIETLRSLDVDSVPVNFLDPRPGTPLEGKASLTPRECLRIIALTRLMLPTKDIVVCGGRPRNLRDLATLVFVFGANGLMVGDYLTTPGRRVEDDLKMIEDLGLKPVRRNM
jgi:biotin synthase